MPQSETTDKRLGRTGMKERNKQMSMTWKCHNQIQQTNGTHVPVLVCKNPRGGGGTLNFSVYVGLGPASILHPPKNVKNFKHPKKYQKFQQPQKISQFCTMTLRKDPKMHRNSH